MTAMHGLLDEPAVLRLGWVLVHFFWQGAAVTVLLAAMLALLRRASASIRRP